jgi:hypothetical protein
MNEGQPLLWIVRGKFPRQPRRKVELNDPGDQLTPLSGARRRYEVLLPTPLHASVKQVGSCSISLTRARRQGERQLLSEESFLPIDMGSAEVS